MLRVVENVKWLKTGYSICGCMCYTLIGWSPHKCCWESN